MNYIEWIFNKNIKNYIPKIIKRETVKIKTKSGEIEKIIELVNNHSEIRGAIITGAGDKAFVAGADIGEFLNAPNNQGVELSKKGQALFLKIEQSKKPIIAAVNGYALGGGCELALSCHFRIASEQAKFGQPEINLGIIPGYGGTQRLPRLIGKGRAMEMMMTGELMNAEEAYRVGLVNTICKPEELLQTAEGKMRTILSKPKYPSRLNHCPAYRAHR